MDDIPSLAGSCTVFNVLLAYLESGEKRGIH